MKCPSCGRTAQLIKSGQLSNGVIKRRYSCNYGCPPFSTEEWLSSKLPAAQAQKTQEEIERMATIKARQLAERMAEVMAKSLAEQMVEERMKAVRVEFSRMVDALQVYRSKVGF